MAQEIKRANILRVTQIHKTATFQRAFQSSYSVSETQWFTETEDTVTLHRKGELEVIEMPKSNLHVVRPA